MFDDVLPGPSRPPRQATPPTVAPRLPVTMHIGASCSVERGTLKYGMDPGATAIDLTKPIPTTIAALAAIPAPTSLPQDSRVPNPGPTGTPLESTLYSIQATLTFFKGPEQDGDYHLVITDAQGSTMIVEIVDPACVQNIASPFLPGITRARQQLEAAFPTATGGGQHTVTVPVTVTGVGFFDRLHGQTGVAPNGVELHPVLDIQFPTAPPPPTPPTPPTPPPPARRSP